MSEVLLEKLIKKVEVLTEALYIVQESQRAIMQYLENNLLKSTTGEKEQSKNERGSGYHEPCSSNLPRGSADSKSVVKEEKIYKESPGFPRKKSETEGIEVDGYTYKNFKMCKYGCGNLVAWNINEKSFAHFTPKEKRYIGMYCPKYE